MPIETMPGITSMPTEFLGIDFAGLSIDQAAAAIALMVKNDTFQYVVTPNVDHVVMLFPPNETDTSARFRAAYNAAALRLCDSRVLRALASLKGIALETVPGSDLTAKLFRDVFSVGHKVAIIGGDATTKQELRQRFPGPDYVQHNPPMGLIDNPSATEAVIAFIEEQRPDFTLFAIGAPRSEIIAHRCMQNQRARGVGICIGASIEFLLGKKARAPNWMQRFGIEWVFRLLSEPRRLWRRYLVDGPRIFFMVAKWRPR